MEKWLNRVCFAASKAHRALVLSSINPTGDVDEILDYIDKNEETGYYEYDLGEI